MNARARYQDESWRVAYRFAGNVAEVKNLAQDAFLKLLYAVPRYRLSAAFFIRTCRVLTRLCIDQRHKKLSVLASPFSLSCSEELNGGRGGFPYCSA